jgi:uncharacterized protein YbcV (DUF1398 family)
MPGLLEQSGNGLDHHRSVFNQKNTAHNLYFVLPSFMKIVWDNEHAKRRIVAGSAKLLSPVDISI